MKKKTHVIVVKENNRRFSVVVPLKSDADKCHIDTQDYETGEKRCDYAIRVTPTSKRFFYYVELKGNDVIKAARQLVSTVEKQQSDYKDYECKEAWIISGGWNPAISTRFQFLQRSLKKFGFELKYKTNEHTIYHV